MLKWTVSRSLSTASSTPHGPGGGGKSNNRRPFRDLSNTPPTARDSMTRRSSSRIISRVSILSDDSGSNGGSGSTARRALCAVKRTPSRRRRCRSHGGDLRGYFHSTKPNSRGDKRSRTSDSPVIIESYYQSTPRVDADIGPLTVYPSHFSSTIHHDDDYHHHQHQQPSSSLTLPADFPPSTLINIVPSTSTISTTTTTATVGDVPTKSLSHQLQSHVSDFFQQISMAASPEDVMESESLVANRCDGNGRIYTSRYSSRRQSRRSHSHEGSNHTTTPHLPKLARVAKLNARTRTPYQIGSFRETPLAGKLLGLKLAGGGGGSTDSPVYEVISETKALVDDTDREQEANFGGKSVAEIMLSDSAERRKVLNSDPKSSSRCIDGPNSLPSSPKAPSTISNPDEEEHIYETIGEPSPQHQMEVHEMLVDDGKAAHNDSTISSASQLLENPSPDVWPFCSPSSDLDGEFPLKRQRVIRRKRQARNNNNNDKDKDGDDESSASKRPRRNGPPKLYEAVNIHVKRLHLETDLDSSVMRRVEDGPQERPVDVGMDERESDEVMQVDEAEDARRNSNHANANSQRTTNDMADSYEPMESESTAATIATRSDESSSCTSRKLACSTTTNTGLAWDVTTDSPRSSSLLDSFATTCTPEPTPLVATVRRCLKYSPETPGSSADPHHCHSQNHQHHQNHHQQNHHMIIGSVGSIEIECSPQPDHIRLTIIRCRDLRRVCEGPINAYVKASLKDPASGEGCVKRTAVHRSTPNPIFHETLLLPCPPVNNHNCATRQVSLDIAVWHRDRRARRSELLGCMTLPLPLSQDKEATWHPLEAGRSSSCVTGPFGARDSLVSPPLSTKDGADSITDNNNSGGPGTGSQTGEELTYLRHLELEPLDPLTGLPLHPGFTARGGRTPCTVTRRLVRPAAAPDNQVPWGFSLSWGRPPRVERVDPGSPAERSGLRPGDYVVFVDATNVVTQPRDDILELIQAATSQLVLEIYRRSGVGSVATTTSATATNTTVLGQNRRSSAFVQAGQNAPVSHHHQVTFTAEVGNGVLV